MLLNFPPHSTSNIDVTSSSSNNSCVAGADTICVDCHGDGHFSKFVCGPACVCAQFHRQGTRNQCLGKCVDCHGWTKQR